MPPSALTLTIVIPAFNEERRLRTTLHAVVDYLRQQTWDWDVRVVDDGSTDQTAAFVESFARDEPRVVLQRESHRGKGGAVKAGLLAARGSYRFICDADLSMPIKELSRFLPPALTGADVAIGSREGINARRVGEPLYRHAVGRVFNFIVQRLALGGIEDSQCGFKMFTGTAVAAIFPLVTVDGWAFDVEALVIAREQRLTIVEVPIEWHYREESRLSMLRDGVAMSGELLRISKNRRAGRYSR